VVVVGVVGSDLIGLPDLDGYSTVMTEGGHEEASVAAAGMTEADETVGRMLVYFFISHDALLEGTSSIFGISEISNKCFDDHRFSEFFVIFIERSHVKEIGMFTMTIATSFVNMSEYMEARLFALDFF
jgi:hypothetical protein